MPRMKTIETYKASQLFTLNFKGAYLSNQSFFADSHAAQFGE